MQWAALKSFPNLHEDIARKYRVMAAAVISHTQIELRYRIEAISAQAFSEIVFPEPARRAVRKDELWKHTCLECFIPGHETKAYLEFNGSPSGDWNWYAFRDYREGMKPITFTGKVQAKAVSQSKSEKDFEMTWVLPMSGVLQGFSGMAENVQLFDYFGLTVVLRTEQAPIYFALRHAGVTPDFHKRASFTYDPIRN